MSELLDIIFWLSVPLGIVGAYAYYKSDHVDLSDDYRTIYDWYSDDDEE